MDLRPAAVLLLRLLEYLGGSARRPAPMTDDKSAPTVPVVLANVLLRV